MDENTKHLVAAQLTQAFCQRHAPGNPSVTNAHQVQQLELLLKALPGNVDHPQLISMFWVYKKFVFLLEQSHSSGESLTTTDDPGESDLAEP